MDRTLNERLAWLAGIIDGEGYVSAGINSFRGSATKPAYRSLRFGIRLANTDVAMIRETRLIADALGITGYFMSGYTGAKAQHKDMYLIHFHGSDRVGRLLRAIMPWLVTKRAAAELLLKLIERRTKLAYLSRSLDDEVMLSLLKELRTVNQRGRNPLEAREPALVKGSRRIPLPEPTLGNVVGPDREPEMTAHPVMGNRS